MPAYVVGVVTITDPSEMQKYAGQVEATIKRHGGRLVAVGPVVETLEGTTKRNRAAVLEFPSVEQARRWYASAEYQEIIGFRHRGATTDLFLV